MNAPLVAVLKEGTPAELKTSQQVEIQEIMSQKGTICVQLEAIHQ